MVKFNRPTKNELNDLVQYVPPLPDVPPEPSKKFRILTDAVFGYVKKAYLTVNEFKRWACSLRKEDSPNKRLCFDDAYAAQLIYKMAEKEKDTFITDHSTAEISRAVKSSMRRMGLSRSQLITKAREIKQIATAQPAE